MTDEYIKKVALCQAAIDSGCSPEDFTSGKPTVVISKPDEFARRYLQLPFFLDLTSYGSNIVASCSPEIADFAAKFIDRPDFWYCFEPLELYRLNDELAKYGQRIRHMAEYYLPDLAALELAEHKNVCPLPIKILEKADFSGLYLPEWSNALCDARPQLDMLGAAAYDGERMVGFAACSADGSFPKSRISGNPTDSELCEMWQIGIDVLPEYRKNGIAKSLVTRLTREILERGRVPFYCAAWSNLRSARCAISSGFRPAWVTITSKPIS